MPLGIIDLFLISIQLHAISLSETEIPFIQVSSPNCNLKKPHRPIPQDPIQDPASY